ncbi:MAG: type III secretion system chaperone [Puniceicoccales bacterium]|nr:type III secretion system chaperone [Puniceicoccales bacterium]
MNVRTEVNELLARLKHSLCLDSLFLDEKDHCILLFDDKVILNMELDEERSQFIIYAYLGMVPFNNKENVYELLLQANFFWQETQGATLALDGQTQTLVLLHSFDIPFRQPENFEEDLASFVETAERWIQKLSDILEETKEAARYDREHV